MREQSCHESLARSKTNGISSCCSVLSVVSFVSRESSRTRGAGRFRFFMIIGFDSSEVICTVGKYNVGIMYRDELKKLWLLDGDVGDGGQGCLEPDSRQTSTQFKNPTTILQQDVIK